MSDTQSSNKSSTFLDAMNASASAIAEMDWTSHEIEVDINLQEGDCIAGYYEGDGKPIINSKAPEGSNNKIPTIRLRSHVNSNMVYTVLCGAQLRKKLEDVPLGIMVGIRRGPRIPIDGGKRVLNTYDVALPKALTQSYQAESPTTNLGEKIADADLMGKAPKSRK